MVGGEFHDDGAGSGIDSNDDNLYLVHSYNLQQL